MCLKGQIHWFSKVEKMGMTLLLCVTPKPPIPPFHRSARGFIMKVYKKLWRKKSLLINAKYY